MRTIVDYLSSNTNRLVVMSEDKYVYFDTHEEVSSELVDLAIKTQGEDILKDAEIKASRDRKNLGIDYTNLDGITYKVSLTTEDANGLIQVKTAFEFGITETNFECSNGTFVPIKSLKDLLHLGEFLVTERNKFFV